MDFHDGQERFSSREGGISDEEDNDGDRSDVERFSDAFSEFMESVVDGMPDSWLENIGRRFFRALMAELSGNPGLRSYLRGVVLDPSIPRRDLELPHTMPPANGPTYGPDYPLESSKQV